jgi:hypothetical protein
MIIRAGIGAADHHDCGIALKEAIVADRWLEKVAVLREPVLEARSTRYHFGRFMGGGSDILLVRFRRKWPENVGADPKYRPEMAEIVNAQAARRLYAF